MSFAERLMIQLKNAKLTQKKLAELIDCQEGIITRWKQGATYPQYHQLIKLSEIFHVSSDYLLGIEEENSAEVFSHEGIKWREQNDISPESPIAQGVVFFRDLLVDGLTVNQLLTKHNIIRRADFRNALKIAFRSGAVTVTRVPRDKKREDAIANQYKLPETNVFVADIPKELQGTIVRAELVCFMATRCVLAKSNPPSAIGLGPGYTILRFAELSVPDVETFVRTKWVPLMSNYREDMNNLSANYIAQVMTNRHPKSESAYFPLIDSEPSVYARENYSNLQKFLVTTEEAFVSINGQRNTIEDGFDSYIYTSDFTTFAGWNLESILQDKIDRFGFEFLGMFFDKDAELMEVDEKYMPKSPVGFHYQATEAQICDISRRGRVWLIATRGYKAEPTRLALEKKLVNALVIDSEIADYLIKHKS